MRALASVHVTFGLGLDVPRKEILLEMDRGMQVGELLLRLEKEYGIKSALRLKVPGHGDLTSPFMVLLNGRNIFHFKGKETPLNDGDRVQILAMLVGG